MKDQLQRLLEDRFARVTNALEEDLQAAANIVATSIAEAYATGDQETAEEAVEQLELLAEVQRLRINREALGALQEGLGLAIGFLFASI